MTTTIAACALYLLCARLECKSALYDARATCAGDYAFATEVAFPDAQLEYSACRSEAWDEYQLCLSYVTEEEVCP